MEAPKSSFMEKNHFVDGNGATIPYEMGIPNEIKYNLGLLIRLSSPYWHGIFSHVNRSLGDSISHFYFYYWISCLGQYYIVASIFMCETIILESLFHYSLHINGPLEGKSSTIILRAWPFSHCI